MTVSFLESPDGLLLAGYCNLGRLLGQLGLLRVTKNDSGILRLLRVTSSYLGILLIALTFGLPRIAFGLLGDTLA